MSWLFIGEQRSPRAIQLGVRWEDEALAAKPLFAALRAFGIDPHDPEQCRFTNLFEEGGLEIVQNHAGSLVALGQKVSARLTALNLTHVRLVHPAARGPIRKRSRYIAHVREQLSPWLKEN